MGYLVRPHSGDSNPGLWLSAWELRISRSAFLSTLVSVTGWAWGGLEWTSGSLLVVFGRQGSGGSAVHCLSRLCLSTRDSSYSFWLPQPPRRRWERARPGPEQSWPWRAAALRGDSVGFPISVSSVLVTEQGSSSVGAGLSAGWLGEGGGGSRL